MSSIELTSYLPQDIKIVLLVIGNDRALEVIEHPIYNPHGIVYRGLRRTRMLILIILLALLFGGGFFGYRRYGTGGGMEIGGIVLVILLAWLCLGGVSGI
jgi:hypothetical protein